jgi:hypothetical protein
LLPDGIHSGLIKGGACGVFFYFQAPSPEGGKNHFWKYVELKDKKIIDNRYIVANLIACAKDTPRVVHPNMFQSIFELQEKVIEDILQSFQEQNALKLAPRSVDPLQQTVATIIQGYLNHPDVDRKQAIELIRFLNQPMRGVQVQELRQAYKNFQKQGNVKVLLDTVKEQSERFSINVEANDEAPIFKVGNLARDDLRLICFDLISGG